jgi:hypothetical protein
MSMLVAITFRAVDALVSGASDSTASAIARLTSGGKSVDVFIISFVMLSLNACIISPPQSYFIE